MCEIILKNLVDIIFKTKIYKLNCKISTISIIIIICHINFKINLFIYYFKMFIKQDSQE